MNKKKKGLWTVLSIIFVVNFAVFGLNLLNPLPEGGEYEEGVLRVWVSWGDDRDHLQPLFDRYTETTGQAVKVVTRAKQDHIEDALNSETPPDVIILSANDLVGLYYQQGLIEPLNAWVDRSELNLDDIYPAPLAQCQMPDGTLVCLPWVGDTFALYWNKDLFAAAGLDPEKPPQTMEELLAYAQLLTIPGEEGFSQVGFLPDYPRPHLDLYTHMFGGAWHSRDGVKLTVNSQPVVDAMNWQHLFYELVGNPEANDFVSSINRYRNSGHPVLGGVRLNCQQCHRFTPGNADRMPDHGFYTGQVAMMVDGAWQLGANYISAYSPDMNYGVAPFPPSAEHPELSNTSFYQGAVVLIPSHGLDLEAAVDLLTWMISPEIVADMAFATTSLPTNQTAAKDLRFQQIPHFDIFIDLLAAENTYAIRPTAIQEEFNAALAGIEKDFLYTEGQGFIPDLDNLQAEYGPILEELVSSRLSP